MFFIPGVIISLLTFPGVIVHEAAHLYFCRKFGLAVFDVCYFRFENVAGYVIHERTDDFKKQFFVGLGPLFVNTALCVLFCSAGFVQVWELKVMDPLAWFFYWLGISMGMHAIPSQEDMKSIWQQAPAEAKKGNWFAIVSFPLVAVLFVLGILRVVWADLGYGIAVGTLVPLAIFKLLV